MLRKLGQSTPVKAGDIIRVASPERITRYGLVTEVKAIGGARHISFSAGFSKQGKTVRQEDLCHYGWVHVMDAEGLVRDLNRKASRPANW